MSILQKDIDTNNDVIVETTEFFPSHFMVRIESFSLLSANVTDRKYESTIFEAGGHKWRLVIYPNGRKCGGDDDNVSVYLSVANPKSLGSDWEVNAIFSIFLHNHTSDNFLCMREKTRRLFHALAPSRGFSKFISKKILNEPSNGYLVDDVCIFGAEVFVFKKPSNIERLSFTKVAKPCLRSWTIPTFSKIKAEYWSTEKFTVRNKSWLIRLYPQGYADAKGHGISVFLYLLDGKNQKVRAKYTFKIKDQAGDKHLIFSHTSWFEKTGSGSFELVSIADLKDQKKSFLVNDCCIFEAEVTVLAVARTSP